MTVTPKLRIATAQTVIKNEEDHPFDGSSSPFPAIDANLRDIATKTAEAAKDGADIVVFPEFCVQGIAEDRWYLAWVDKAIFGFLSALAKQHGIAICGSVLTGTVPEDLRLPPAPSSSPFENLMDPEAKGLSQAQLDWCTWISAYKSDIPPDFHPVVKNTAFFIGDDGQMLATYDKRNLWHPERVYVNPGESFCKVFQTKWGKAGMMICWDLSHSSAAQWLSDEGVDLVFVPAYWLATDPEPWLSKHEHDPDYEKHLVQSWMFGRAVETESVWVLSNVSGDEKKGFMGGSGIWAPLRGKVAGFERAEEGLVFADIDLVNILRDTKEAYKIREDYGKSRL